MESSPNGRKRQVEAAVSFSIHCSSVFFSCKFLGVKGILRRRCDLSKFTIEYYFCNLPHMIMIIIMMIIIMMMNCYSTRNCWCTFKWLLEKKTAPAPNRVRHLEKMRYGVLSLPKHGICQEAETQKEGNSFYRPGVSGATVDGRNPAPVDK